VLGPCRVLGACCVLRACHVLRAALGAEAAGARVADEPEPSACCTTSLTSFSRIA
jgi:hypothetical protein